MTNLIHSKNLQIKIFQLLLSYLFDRLYIFTNNYTMSSRLGFIRSYLKINITPSL